MDKDFFTLKVTTIGNSFGVTLPRHLCRALRIDRTAVLELIRNGPQMSLQVVSRGDRAGQPDRFDLAMLMRVLDRLGMTETDFVRLSYDGTPWRTFHMDVDVGGCVDLVTVARLRACAARRGKPEYRAEPWSETVDAVLLAIPNQSVVADRIREAPAREAATREL